MGYSLGIKRTAGMRYSTSGLADISTQAILFLFLGMVMIVGPLREPLGGGNSTPESEVRPNGVPARIFQTPHTGRSHYPENCPSVDYRQRGQDHGFNVILGLSLIGSPLIVLCCFWGICHWFFRRFLGRPDGIQGCGLSGRSYVPHNLVICLRWWWPRVPVCPFLGCDS